MLVVPARDKLDTRPSSTPCKSFEVCVCHAPNLSRCRASQLGSHTPPLPPHRKGVNIGDTL
eukprot:3856111-Prymnesium_polylepis.1